MQFTDQNFQEEVENNTELVLVDFSAPWCGPCQLMGPIIDEVIKEYENKDIKIGKLDIDENPVVAEKYHIMSVPTIMLFKKGKIIDQINGYCGKRDLMELIDKNLTKER